MLDMIRDSLTFKLFCDFDVGNRHDVCVVDQNIDEKKIVVRRFRRCTNESLRCEIQFKQSDENEIDGFDDEFNDVQN